MFWNKKSQEEKNQEAALAVSEFADSLDDPLELLSSMSIYLILNVLLWLTALLIPNLIVRLFTFLEIGAITTFIAGIAFGVGFYLSYTIIRYKIPNVEENKDLDSNLMGSINYQSSANRKYYVWIGAILSGLLNLTLLGIVGYTLDYNGLYLFDY